MPPTESARERRRIALSVLEQSPVTSGSTPAMALGETVELACLAEQLGYRRFWLAEHHNTTSIAGTAPEILLTHIAGETGSIKVGTGGVLLSYYSPLKVAETFRTLEALFPGRIDLGLGRADGADPPAVIALHDARDLATAMPYQDKVSTLLAYLEGDAEGERPDVVAMPTGAGSPEVWVLASSIVGAELAAVQGLPFCFAHFISPTFGARVTASYRRLYRPSKRWPEPKIMVGVSVMCAPDQYEAERMAASADIWHLSSEGTGRGPLPTYAEAARFRPNQLQTELLNQQRQRRVAGSPESVLAALTDIAVAYEADELVLRTVCPDPKDRARSFELVAEAFARSGL
ncbi:MAG: LLM class flavin-dependent oxidoreductase [Acidimicrobiales bacterium]